MREVFASQTGFVVTGTLFDQYGSYGRVGVVTIRDGSNELEVYSFELEELIEELKKAKEALDREMPGHTAIQG